MEGRCSVLLVEAISSLLLILNADVAVAHETSHALSSPSVLALLLRVSVVLRYSVDEY